MSGKGFTILNPEKMSYKLIEIKFKCANTENCTVYDEQKTEMISPPIQLKTGALKWTNSQN